MEEIELYNGDSNKNGLKKKKKKKKTKKAKSEYDEEAVNNILDESVEIDNEALVKRKEEDSKKVKVLFKAIECNKSLYLFSKVNSTYLNSYRLTQ